MKKEKLQLTAEIQKIIRECYGKKIDNLEEMVSFLEKSNLPVLNQEEIDTINNPLQTRK